MTIEELQSTAADVAQALRQTDPMTKDVRDRFVAVRSELFRRGIFDPVLARFDTISVPRASIHEIAEQLAAVTSSLASS